MEIQHKKDLRTIFEVLAFIVIYFSINRFLDEQAWLSNTLFVFAAIWVIYRSYFLKYRSDTILFPTQNDSSSKMSYAAFGIIIIFFSAVGYFAFDFKFYQSTIIFVMGVLLLLFGFFESPKGWLRIKDNLLTMYGVGDAADIRQLKEIALYNDKVTLSNVYDEQKTSTLLNLNPSAAQSLRKFLEIKLGPNKVSIIDHVTEAI